MKKQKLEEISVNDARYEENITGYNVDLLYMDYMAQVKKCVITFRGVARSQITEYTYMVFECMNDTYLVRFSGRI